MAISQKSWVISLGILIIIILFQYFLLFHKFPIVFHVPVIFVVHLVLIFIFEEVIFLHVPCDLHGVMVFLHDAN